MAHTYKLAPRGYDAGLFMLRLVVGAVFMAHGAQKLFMSGVPEVTNTFSQIGVPYAEYMAPFVAGLEFFGGFMLIIGVLTRLVAMALTIDMIVALVLVHLPNGFFLPNGLEFVMTLAGTCLALVLAGAGAYSVDAAVSRRRRVVVVPPAPAYATSPPRTA